MYPEQVGNLVEKPPHVVEKKSNHMNEPDFRIQLEQWLLIGQLAHLGEDKDRRK